MDLILAPFFFAAVNRMVHFTPLICCNCYIALLLMFGCLYRHFFYYIFGSHLLYFTFDLISRSCCNFFSRFNMHFRDEKENTKNDNKTIQVENKMKTACFIFSSFRFDVRWPLLFSWLLNQILL